MDLDLRENMYIRTKDGIIDKILKLNKSYVKGVSQKDELYAYDIDNIVKASYNIIDLIEKNDYINGSWVNEIVDGKPIHEDYNDPFYSFGWENDDIKTVITHEQMEQMSYKVSD